MTASAAHALRATALAALRAATEAEATATFRVCGPPGAQVMSGVTVAGDAVLRRLMCSFEGGPAPSGSIGSDDARSADARRLGWNLATPLARSINRFGDSARDFRVPLERLEVLDAVRRWRGPGSIAQEYRMLVYDDAARFVGWIGALRCGRRPFRPEQQRRADRLAPRLARLLLQADALERLEGVAHLHFDAAFRLVGECSDAARWLTPERRHDLERAISAGESRLVRHGVCAEFLPLLDGAGGRGTIVKLTALADVCMRGTALPPRQRQIADAWLQGQSVPQIGHALGLSPNTVGFHLKALYARFGVGSRLGLLRALEGPTPALPLPSRP